MALNNKAQVIGMFFLFMAGIIIFILAFALAPTFKNSSDTSRANMNCNNASISTDQKVVCTTIDISTPMIVAIILGLGTVAFGAKLLIG